MTHIIRDHLNFNGTLMLQDQYQTMYQESINDPEKFWAAQ